MEDDSKSGRFLPIFICFVLFPTIAVLGRTWSRIVATKSKFGWDDFFCMFAYLTTIALCAGSYEQYRLGLGKHIVDLEVEAIEFLLKLLYVCFWLFILSITLVKLSALSLYARLFGRGDRAFNIAIIIGYVVTAVFQISATVEFAIFCIPLSKFWNPFEPGWCLPQTIPWLSGGIFDMVLDLYILLLPLPMLWRLQLKLSRKISAAVALIIAYSTLVASIGRLIVIAKAGSKLTLDFTWNDFNLLMWCLAEPCMAVIGLCVPAWYALIKRIMRGGFHSLLHSQDIPEPSPSPDQWSHPPRNELAKIPSSTYSASAVTYGSSRSLKPMSSEASYKL